MSAQVYFSDARVCSGGNHFQIDVGVNIDGRIRTKTLHTTPEDLRENLTEDEINDFLKVCLKIMRVQRPTQGFTSFRQSALSKIIDLSI